MSSSASDFLKQPGVSDLRGKAKMRFALALSHEAAGRKAEAAAFLDQAIDAEEKGE